MNTKRAKSLVLTIFLAVALTGCSTAYSSTVPSAPEGGHEMPKTLVFNFDGTDNEPSDVDDFAKDESISNIFKLHVLMGGGIKDVVTPDGDEQRAFYYPGIGTYGNKIRKWINETVAPGGWDSRSILSKARNNLDEFYEKGDRVVVFGFSRGAALAREFVAGILEEDDNLEVAFLGVFDTVVEMEGLEERKTEFLGESDTLNERVQHAVHIVALDEDRRTFRPTLINKDDSDSNRILEVWFPGIHTDIGGGHWDDGLSDQTLAFMIEQCKDAMGSAIQISDGDWETIDALLKKLKEKDSKKYQDLKADDIAIHPMGVGVLHVNQGWKTALEDELRGPTPRSVCVNGNDQCRPDAYPLIHHSAKERLDRVPGYRPASLRNVEFKLLLANGDQRGPIRGINGLREAAKIVPLE